jgi:predicted metal-dependent phosphoesterase TrpH
MKWIDLHVHSSCSDGTLTPSELVTLARDCGLGAFALTDHDNTDGIAEAVSAADAAGIELIPGIEFSTEYHGKDIHVVGLDLDWRNPALQERIDYYRDERLRRNRKMIDRMAADGIEISYEKMLEAFGETVWTRAHFARYLADHGYVREMKDAFLTHIGDDCKYFVPREKVHPEEVVRLIRTFGGIPILAHPFQYGFPEEELLTLLRTLKDAGLIGMEVYYSGYTNEQVAQLLALADRLSLAPSGGSDFHGTNKPTISLGTGTGSLQIPYSVLEHLRNSSRRQLSSAPSGRQPTDFD